MKRLYLFLLFLYSLTYSYGQEKSQPSFFNIGIGAGLDYGGVGIKIPMISFKPYVQFFGGLGYNGAGPGFNAGLLIRSSPIMPIATYFTAMYGSNAVIISESATGNTRTARTYFGPSVGGGIEFRANEHGNFFTFGLVFPIRSDKFKDDSKLINAIRRPADVVLSVGYHFTFGQ